MAELHFFELIYYEYMDYCCKNNKMSNDSKEIKAFSKKYIEPLLKQNPKEGFEMEEMFNRAVVDNDIQCFINGFKACTVFLISCLSDKTLLEHFSKKRSGDII